MRFDLLLPLHFSVRIITERTKRTRPTAKALLVASVVFIPMSSFQNQGIRFVVLRGYFRYRQQSPSTAPLLVKVLRCSLCKQIGFNTYITSKPHLHCSQSTSHRQVCISLHCYVAIFMDKYRIAPLSSSSFYT